MLKPAIAIYIKLYKVQPDLFDIETDEYRCFNDFFIRKIKPGSRPFSGVFASPIDGKLYASGSIEDQTLLQVKGQSVSVTNLLAEQDNTLRSYWSFYLAPGDYHRVHAPCDMEIKSVTYIPGTFYSVSPRVARKKPVFLKNERVVIRSETSAGTIYLVMIAALNVGNIGLKVFNDTIPADKKLRKIENFPGPAHYKQGDEIGRFNFGSAVVLLTPKTINKNNKIRKVNLGESLV